MSKFDRTTPIDPVNARWILDMGDDKLAEKLLVKVAKENWGRRTITRTTGSVGVKGCELQLDSLEGLHPFLLCTLCKLSLRRPVYLKVCMPQHHVFCHECLLLYMRERGTSQSGAGCPTCGRHYSTKHIAEEKTLDCVVRLLCGDPVPIPEVGVAGGSSGSGGGGGSSGGGGAGKKRSREEAEGAGAAATAAAASGGGGGGGGGKAKESSSLKERITYRMEVPFPANFPNLVASAAALAAAAAAAAAAAGGEGGGGNHPSASVPNRKILLLSTTQTLLKNKEYLLKTMATRAAAEQGIVGFDPGAWRLELYVGPPSGVRVKLEGDDKTTFLCTALRSALRKLGKEGDANRKEGESGADQVPGAPANPLGTIWVRVCPA